MRSHILCLAECAAREAFTQLTGIVYIVRLQISDIFTQVIGLGQSFDLLTARVGVQPHAALQLSKTERAQFLGESIA